MTGHVAILLLAIVPHDAALADRVDVIEVNHFYDDSGRHVFDQVIFWDFNWRHCRFEVRDWRMVKKPNQFPKLNLETGLYSATWNDGEVLREVRAASMRESWTQDDPELSAREAVPKEKRRLLRSAAQPCDKPVRTIELGAQP